MCFWPDEGRQLTPSLHTLRIKRSIHQVYTRGRGSCDSSYQRSVYASKKLAFRPKYLPLEEYIPEILRKKHIYGKIRWRFRVPPSTQSSGITEYAIFRNHRVRNRQESPSTQSTYIYIPIYIYIYVYTYISDYIDSKFTKNHKKTLKSVTFQEKAFLWGKKKALRACHWSRQRLFRRMFLLVPKYFFSNMHIIFKHI